MRYTRPWNVAIVIVAAGALVLLSDLHHRAMGGILEVNNPTLFARLEPLWGVLTCIVPGIAVGFFATRSSIYPSGSAYLIGALVDFYRHGRYGTIAVGNILPEHQFILPLLREFAIVVVIGITMAQIGAWLRRRLTFVETDTRHRLR